MALGLKLTCMYVRNLCTGPTDLLTNRTLYAMYQFLLAGIKLLCFVRRLLDNIIVQIRVQVSSGSVVHLRDGLLLPYYVSSGLVYFYPMGYYTVVDFIQCSILFWTALI